MTIHFKPQTGITSRELTDGMSIVDVDQSTCKLPESNCARAPFIPVFLTLRFRLHRAAPLTFKS